MIVFRSIGGLQPPPVEMAGAGSGEEPDLREQRPAQALWHSGSAGG